MTRTQDHRTARVVTPVTDAILLEGMEGTESLGQPYEYLVTLCSEDCAVVFADIVGQQMTVELQRPDGNIRYFDGIVSRFGQTDSQGRVARYQAILVPTVWLLSRTSDCRIFQNLSVVEIVERILQEGGTTNYRLELLESYPTLEYCVQYRETDLNFISRLLEDAGIYYFFEHRSDGHTMVLIDGPTYHEPTSGYEALRYLGPDNFDSDIECIQRWTAESELQSAIYAHTDYDYTKPRVSLETKASSPDANGGPQLEVFDYPGGYLEVASGQSVAHRRMEELKTRTQLRAGQSNAHGLATGSTFTLDDAIREDDCITYLLTSVTHTIVSDAYDSSQD